MLQERDTKGFTALIRLISLKLVKELSTMPQRPLPLF